MSCTNVRKVTSHLLHEMKSENQPKPMKLESSSNGLRSCSTTSGGKSMTNENQVRRRRLNSIFCAQKWAESIMTSFQLKVSIQTSRSSFERFRKEGGAYYDVTFNWQVCAQIFERFRKVCNVYFTRKDGCFVCAQKVMVQNLLLSPDNVWEAMEMG